MPDLTDTDIQAIIARVKERVSAGDIAGRTAPALEAAHAVATEDDAVGDGVFRTVDDAVAAAKRSFAVYRSLGLDRRKGIIEAVRVAMRRENERLAYMARQETGIGRADDKVIKNLLVIDRTPGPEDLEPKGQLRPPLLRTG